MYLPKLILLHWQQIIFVLFSAVAFIQLFYYVFFFSRLTFYTQKEKPISQTHAVSVIVCARDEAKNLLQNLPASLTQDYQANHEVIVVNDNSFDDSKYILEEFKRTYKQLQVVELTQEAKMIAGKKFPLSIGIKTAKHEIVLLTDADCAPASEHWIDSMQQHYDVDTEIVLGYGAYQKNTGLLNLIIRWETFHSALQYFSYALAGVPYMGVGRNLSYKKQVFFRHKGFSAHNGLPGGDDDLFVNTAANKKNTKINIDKNSFTLSKPASTWDQWLSQKKRHYTTSKYYRPLHKLLLSIYAFTHFLFYPLLIATCLFYDWKYALMVFAGRMVIQAIVYYKTMNKLGEKDLFPFFIFLDAWMFLYYIIFAPALMKKPKSTWK